VSTTDALRTIIVDLAPPEAACGARPVLDPTLPALTSIAGVVTGLSVAFTATPAATSAVWYDFGDGTWDYVAAPGTATHVYTKAGTYTAKASQNGKWVSTTVTVGP
jgi:PKD repeat protein